MNELPHTPKSINPLWMIFLFFSFTEIMLGVGVLNTLGGVQTALVSFVILFPTGIAMMFFVILWFRPKHFYAPKDYSNDQSFLEMMRTERTYNPDIAGTIEKTLTTFLTSPELAEKLSNVSSEGISSLLKEEALRATEKVKNS